MTAPLDKSRIQPSVPVAQPSPVVPAAPKQEVFVPGTESADRFTRTALRTPDAGMRRGFGRTVLDSSAAIRTVPSVGTFSMAGHFERLDENGFSSDVDGMNRAYFG